MFRSLGWHVFRNFRLDVLRQHVLTKRGLTVSISRWLLHIAHSKVVRRRTSVGQTQAGDVLIISEIGEASLCSYCRITVHVLTWATVVKVFHSEKNAANDLFKRFPPHSGTVKMKHSMFS